MTLTKPKERDNEFEKPNQDSIPKGSKSSDEEVEEISSVTVELNSIPKGS